MIKFYPSFQLYCLGALKKFFSNQCIRENESTLNCTENLTSAWFAIPCLITNLKWWRKGGKTVKSRATLSKKVCTFSKQITSLFLKNYWTTLTIVCAVRFKLNKKFLRTRGLYKDPLLRSKVEKNASLRVLNPWPCIILVSCNWSQRLRTLREPKE